MKPRTAFLIGLLAVLSLGLSAGVLSYAHNKFSRIEAKIDRWDAQTRNMRVRTDLLAVRRLILSLQPKLKDAERRGDRLALTQGLRRFVHAAVPQRAGPAGDQASTSMYWFFRSAVCDPEQGYLCQGLSQTLMIALEAFGIPTRRIDLYSATDASYSAHSSLDAYVNGEWIAVDPTFDAAFRFDGRLIGWREVRRRLLDGARIGDEIEVLGDWDASGLPELVRHMVVSSARLSGVGKVREVEGRILPEHWDGTLTLKNGETLNVAYDSTERIDYILSRGPLR